MDATTKTRRQQEAEPSAISYQPSALAAKPTCDLCGGEIRAHNIYGVCQRNDPCKAENEHRRRLANRKKIRKRARASYAANRDKRIEQSRVYRARKRLLGPRCELCDGPIRRNNLYGVCMRNKRCHKEHRRREYVAHKQQYAERTSAWRRANRQHLRDRKRDYHALHPEKSRERARHWHAANREKAKQSSREWYEANREQVLQHSRNDRALRGGIPISRRAGRLSPNWQGGENMACSVPGCHRMAGWRSPNRIKKNKTGFRCPVHRHVRLPPIKEEDYEYQSPEEIRSSVA